MTTTVGRGKARPMRRALALLTLVSVASLGGACSSDTSKPPPRGLTTHASGGMGANATVGSGGSGATGGTTLVTLTGGSNGVGASAGSGTAATAGETPCQSQDFAATRVPLDLYVMLDSSESMTETTGNTTKWDAVGKAITSFVNDPSSAGIGIGLQFFPLRNPDAPLECRSDADCTGFGVCNQRFCQDAGPDFYGCGKSSDCVFNGQNLGPCAPLTHCWSSFIASGGYVELCHNDNDCGRVGDCIPFSHCGTNENILCNGVGRACQDANGNALGTCVQQGPVSTCEHWASCDAGTYAAPVVEIAPLPGIAPSIISAIGAKEPAGATPSAPALAGAIQQAHDWALAHPDHQVAVVLATDGLPSECIADPNGDPSGIQGVTAAAKAGVSGTPSVKTFVIGVFGADDTTAPQNLDDIAVAGGTEKAFVVTTGSDVEQQFLDALDTIRGSGIACELQIPTPTSGKPDFGRVNVYFTETDTPELLYNVPDASSCETGENDWYYGMDAAGVPNKIIACPDTCARFQAATMGKVTIGVGCLTVVR